MPLYKHSFYLILTGLSNLLDRRWPFVLSKAFFAKLWSQCYWSEWYVCKRFVAKTFIRRHFGRLVEEFLISVLKDLYKRSTHLSNNNWGHHEKNVNWSYCKHGVTYASIDILDWLRKLFLKQKMIFFGANTDYMWHW